MFKKLEKMYRKLRTQCIKIRISMKRKPKKKLERNPGTEI